MCRATSATLQRHQVCLRHEKWYCKFSIKFAKTGTTSFIMRGWSDHDPKMIWPWNRQSATRLATEVAFRGRHEPFYWKMHQKFTRCYSCPARCHSDLTKYCAWDEKWCFHFHQIMHLPRKKVTPWTSPNAAPSDTWLCYALTLVFLYLFLTLLLLNGSILCSAILAWLTLIY